MDFLALLIAPILFIGAVLYIAYPLLQDEKKESAPDDEATEEEKALREKEDIIDSLKDIDMDFRMGKLSTKDYQSLKLDFEQQAVEIFQRIQSPQALNPPSAQEEKKESAPEDEVTDEEKVPSEVSVAEPRPNVGAGITENLKKKDATKFELLKAIPIKRAFWTAVVTGLGVMAIPVTSSLWNGMWAENGLYLVKVLGGSGVIVGAIVGLLPWLCRLLDINLFGFDD